MTYGLLCMSPVAASIEGLRVRLQWRRPLRPTLSHLERNDVDAETMVVTHMSISYQPVVMMVIWTFSVPVLSCLHNCAVGWGAVDQTMVLMSFCNSSTASICNKPCVSEDHIPIAFQTYLGNMEGHNSPRSTIP